uniref:Sinapine esterase n=1 Tax=Opuntia streptacantha TaxID=393608 RepID=A0A7C9ECT7_OPUST
MLSKPYLTVLNLLMCGQRVIDMGASKMIIAGMFPLGCFPAHVLAAFPANYTPSYDEHRCSNDLNNLSITHNDQLRWGVQQLSQEHQNVTILYGDYYNAFRRLLKNAPRFGFNATFDVKTTCCGIGRRYNFNPRKMCGHRGVPVCSNPDTYVIWDGLNLTQKANRLLARWLIRTTISHI